jgi:DNA-binding CsgD family transcriptional regulator
VAIWKMEGHTNREIAGKLDCVEQTVERKLRSIRRIWSNEEPS